MVAVRVLVAVLGALTYSAEGFAGFESTVPNSAKVRTTLSNANGALGHSVTTRTVDAFGRAWSSGGRKWTEALCRADSDNDGIPNGVELGDPNCQWKSAADNGILSATISDPGNSASKVVTSPPTTPAPTPLPTTRPPVTSNPTVAGAAPTQKPTEFPTNELTPAPVNGAGNAGNGAGSGSGTDTTPPVGGAATSSVSAANGAGISPAVLGAGAAAAALVVLAVVNNRNKHHGAAIVARMNSGKGPAMSPYGSSVVSAPQHRSGQPGAGEELTA
jgi:hypothetical protein